MLLINGENFRQRALHRCPALETGAVSPAGPPRPAAGTGHWRHRLAAGAAQAPKTIQLLPFHFISLAPGVWRMRGTASCDCHSRKGTAVLCCRGDRGHSAGTLANQVRLTARVTEPLCLPVVGFSRLSASSEMAPVVMVFFSLETPEAAAAAAPGFVSMSSLLARFSWDTEGGTGQDSEYSQQLVQNARFPC